MSVVKVVVALGVVLGLGGGAVLAAHDLGARDFHVAATPTPYAEPVNPTLPPADVPISTLAPVPPPTPSYNYVWDANRHDQCFDPSDPNLPPNAPRCPIPVPPDPGGPKIICPSGYALVYPDGHTPTCEPTKPTH